MAAENHQRDCAYDAHQLSLLLAVARERIVGDLREAIILLSAVSKHLRENPGYTKDFPWERQIDSVLSQLAPFVQWNGHALRFGDAEEEFKYRPSFGGWAVDQLLKGSSPEAIVHDAASVIESNSATFLEVYLCRGLSVDHRVDFDDDTYVVPLDELPPSEGKARLLEHRTYGYPDNEPRSVIVVEFNIQPVAAPTPPLSSSKAPSGNSDARHQRAFDVLRSLILAGRRGLSIPALYLAPKSAGYPTSRVVFERVGVDGDLLFAPMFEMSDAQRTFSEMRKMKREDLRQIRLASDRLGRWRMTSDVVGNAMDLGSALEVLLLYSDGNEKEEITHKIGLRAGWLLGSTVAEREANSKLAKRVYGLRSKAVHQGYLEDEDLRKVNLLDADDLVRALVRRIIDLGRFPLPWSNLELGGMAAPRAGATDPH